MTYYIFNGSDWVEVAKPNQGQEYRFIDSAGGMIQTYWSDEVPDMRITRLAFLERFTDAEAVAIDLAGQGATVEAASVRRFMSKVNAATFIDLARQDTQDGVNSLVGAGFLTAPRAAEILTSPIQDIERYNG